jgi:hypothetical protein
MAGSILNSMTLIGLGSIDSLGVRDAVQDSLEEVAFSKNYRLGFQLISEINADIIGRRLVSA